MRQAEPVARLARGDHRARRAAGALGVGPGRIGPEAQRHAERVRPGAQERDRAVDAAAHRDGDAFGMRLGAEDLRERVRERVDGERLAADRRGLEQRQPRERRARARRVGVDDAVAVDRRAGRARTRPARGVSDDLDHAGQRSATVKGPLSGPGTLHPAVSFSCAGANLASQVGALPSVWQRLGRTRAPFHVVLVHVETQQHVRGRAARRL